MNEKLEQLRRQLDQKTTEIESLVAQQQDLGAIDDLDSAEYELLQAQVEEILDNWEEAAEEGSRGLDDATLNRLIAERFEIEQQIEAMQGGSGQFMGDFDEDHEGERSNGTSEGEDHGIGKHG